MRHSPTIWGMLPKLKTFLQDESGATAIEYSLIAAGIALAIVAVVQGIGTKLTVPFSTVASVPVSVGTVPP